MPGVWMLEDQMQQSMEVIPVNLSCCWEILSWMGFRHRFLPQFSHLFSWSPVWRGTSHECFFYLHYFLPLTSFKDKSKHQNKTLQESFSQNFLLCSRPTPPEMFCCFPLGCPSLCPPPAGRAVLGSVCQVGTEVSTEPIGVTEPVEDLALWCPWIPSSSLSL